MKKIMSICVALLTLVALGVIPYGISAKENGGTCYYLDSSAAANGDGLSEGSAWNKIEQINSHGEFKPGESILIKCGSVFEGVTMEPKGSGTKEQPVVIDSYGKGDKPLIDRKGEFDPDNGKNGTYAIKFMNQSYWTIKNIEVSNNSPKQPGEPEDIIIKGDSAVAPMRGGILFTGMLSYNKKTVISGLILDHVTVSHIDCMGADECLRLMETFKLKSVASGAGGIALRGDGNPANGTSRVCIDDVLIQNCEFLNVGGTPVSSEAGWNYTDNVTNLIVRNNYIHSTDDHKMTGHGIYIVNAKNPLIEYNKIENTGNGIAVQVCNGALIQYNTVTGTDGYMHMASKLSGEDKRSDGCAYDVDTNVEGEIIFRNNFSANAYSDAYVAFDYENNTHSPSKNNAVITIENNISVNDKIFLHYPAANKLYTINASNNTVCRFAGSKYEDQKNIIEIEQEQARQSAVNFDNNIFYYPDLLVRFSRGNATTYSGNLYFGNIARIPNDDESAMTDDPLLVLPEDKMFEEWNYSYNGTTPGTDDFCKTDYFGFAKKSPCVKDGRQLCGADMSVFKNTGETGKADSKKFSVDLRWEKIKWVVIMTGVVVAAIGFAAAMYFLILKKKI